MHAKFRPAVLLTGTLLIAVSGLSLAESPAIATSDVSLKEELTGPETALFTDEKPAAPNAPVRVAVAPHKRVVASLTIVKNPASGLLAVVQQPDILPEDQKLMDSVLRLVLPPRCQNIIQKLYVYYGNDLKSRGYAGATTLIIEGSLPVPEKRAIAIHEATHVLDLGCLIGTPASGESVFKDGITPMYNDDPSVQFYGIDWASENIQKKEATKADFVSGYAASNAFEDIAETVAYYVVAKDAFVLRAAKNSALAAKLKWIETYVFPGGMQVADGKKWDGKIPWDVTKLSYVWTGTESRVAVSK